MCIWQSQNALQQTQIQDGEESKIIFYYKYISYEEVSINSSV